MTLVLNRYTFDVRGDVFVHASLVRTVPGYGYCDSVALTLL